VHMQRLLVTFTNIALLCAALAASAGACGSKTDEGAGTTGAGASPGCDVTGCTQPQVCEQVEGKVSACFAPVSFKGRVFDAVTTKGIAGARVVARDPNDAALSTVAITAMDGTYTLSVPSKRDAMGNPVKASVTLRADATGYQTFPAPPRVAIPIDLASAMGTPPLVQSAATDIGLIPLPSAMGLGSVAGKVGSLTGADGKVKSSAGALVLAGGATGIADLDGNYEVFNVPAGMGIEVSAYAQGLNITPAKADVTAGKQTPNINLTPKNEATAVVSGKVSIVNGMGASSTSVILALEATFNATAARGEAPKGLRAANVTGDFSIPGVPDGKYVVLAAFENDGLVRDPDTSIGGTQIVHITVAGASQPISSTFKITGALPVVSPGADKIDTVMGMPSFSWGDDSSEDHYELRVFDALGTKVWENLAVPGVSGQKTVTAMYAGPALKAGMIYQFRAVSIGKDGVPISTTEDLKGVFAYK
jgi:hypothetical protein